MKNLTNGAYLEPVGTDETNPFPSPARSRHDLIKRQLEGSRTGNQPHIIPGRPLTEREREILLETAMGYESKQTAQRLVISYQTVKNHKTNIYVKLDVWGAAEAVALLMVTDDEFYAEVKSGFEERRDGR